VAAPDLLTTVLRDVSRSFYLTMRVLPGNIRRQIGLAYLLARTTDTIADTEIVPVERRLAALRDLQDRIVGRYRNRLDFSEFTQTRAGAAPPFMAQCENALRDIEYDKLTNPNVVTQQGSEAERALLLRVEEILAVANGFPAEDQRMIQDVLSTITSGQELDLQRFGGATVKKIAALETMDELDDYTYRVAGCVGEFWTRMCRTHVFPDARVDEGRLFADGIRFGKGLQLVNVLRDLPADLRHGRCYLPRVELAKAGIEPGDLLDPCSEPRLRPLYRELLERTDAHLRAGWDYTLALPRSCLRVRLACAWPILIGARTLAKLRERNVLDGTQRIKISRSEVKRIMVRSIVTYPSTRSWNQLYQHTAQPEKTYAAQA
jgi:farnesyl-diphosphate farnesyltransferase